MKNTTFFLIILLSSIIFTSCEKLLTNSDPEDESEITGQFNNHWFTDFNGTIDGGEGHDIIKSSVDGKLYICGAFLHVNEDSNKKNLARWNPSENLWENVPGIDKYHSNFIRCVAEDSNGNLYFGGDFSKIGGAKAYKVGKFEPSTGTWTALRDINFYDEDQQYGPVGGGVYSIAVSGNYVYIGGGHFTTDSTALKYIRRFNISTKKWEAVGTGTNGRVRSLTVDDQGNVYAGGEFTEAGGTPANYIAKWNGSTWEALGDGTDNYVLTVEYNQGNLYAGGSFKNVGGGTRSQGAAFWNGTSWEAMEMGIYASWGNSYTVQDIAIDNEGKVYLGGFFDRSYSDDSVLNHVAVFQNGTLQPLGDGLATSSSQGVIGMCSSGKDIYFTGYFTRGSGDPNKKINVAIWNETK